jgi:phage-related protein
MRWRYYRTEAGRDIVGEELQALGSAAEGAVLDAMKRARARALLPYEQETIDGELRALRVFLDGQTYRVLYAHEGKRDQVLLALHAMQKKDRKLPLKAKRLAEKRLRDWRQRGQG